MSTSPVITGANRVRRTTKMATRIKAIRTKSASWNQTFGSVWYGIRRLARIALAWACSEADWGQKVTKVYMAVGATAST